MHYYNIQLVSKSQNLYRHTAQSRQIRVMSQRWMETASSPFLARTGPKQSNFDSSDFRFRIKNKSSPGSNHFTINFSFTSFEPIKKLIRHTSQKLQILKKASPPKELHQEKISSRNPSAIFFDILDDFICDFLESPLVPYLDPKQIFSSNYAPVDELPPTACDVVEGSLPRCLHGGAYIRNGPNPQFINLKRPCHFLDGDGMLHVVRISESGDGATYCSRYVKTYKYRIEREMGSQVFPSVFSSFSGSVAASIARLLVSIARVLVGQYDPLSHGLGVANTSLTLFRRRMFALCESDLPYEVKVTPEGDIVTLGRHDFRINSNNTKGNFLTMTAHPKMDRETGEMFAYGSNVTRPFLTFFIIDPDGEIRHKKVVPIHSILGITAIHDFAVTKNYTVFPDTQIVVRPSWIMERGRSLVGVDRDKVPRLGVIPRYAEDESEMWWIDVPGFNLLHCFNAWEEAEEEEAAADRIVILASNDVAVDKFLENIGSSRLTLEKVTIDLKGRRVHRHPLSTTKFLEYAVINPAYAGKKNRYIYAGVIGPTDIVGLVKLDQSLASEVVGDCTVASRLYEPGWCGSEPFFVAKEPDNPEAEEDDGYLVTFVHDENANESKFLVMDAKSPNLGIVATVKLPRRVPNGFHGIFVPGIDLN